MEITLTNENFEEEVLNSDVPVLVVFLINLIPANFHLYLLLFTIETENLLDSVKSDFIFLFQIF